MMFTEEVARLISKTVKQNLPDILSVLEVPPNPQMGDLAFPCFGLAKEFKKSPIEIAKELSQTIKPEEFISSIIPTGPYLNFFLNKEMIAEKVLTTKHIVVKRKERVMVEHSNGNTHKEVHIGHLRNLALGDSLVRILKAAGYPVVNAYYINDTGAHVARCLWAMQQTNKEAPEEKKLSWLADLYRKGAQLANEDEQVKKEINDVLHKLENGDKDITALWKKTRQWSINDWHRIFKQLNMLPFDAEFYDSEVIKDVPLLVEELKKKGIIKPSEGAMIADLEEEKLNIAVIAKSDGTTPYIAKDLALAARKFNEFNIERNIYVVGSEQELHFQQVFKILEKNGFAQAKKCHHVSYGLVMLSSGKMSSREGKIILFDDLYQDVYDHALNEVKLRHEEWEEKKKEKTAQAIVLAALKFPMVNQEPIKKIIFDIKKSLDFEGETGPYLQYTYARMSSIIRKYGKKITNNIKYEILVADEEQAIIKLLAKEQEVIIDAAEKYKPALIGRYCLDLAQAVNSYYHSYNILKEVEDVKKARLFLLFKTKETLGRITELLGIPTLEEM